MKFIGLTHEQWAAIGSLAQSLLNFILLYLLIEILNQVTQVLHILQGG